jgi:hypothetical protein
MNMEHDRSSRPMPPGLLSRRCVMGAGIGLALTLTACERRDAASIGSSGTAAGGPPAAGASTPIQAEVWKTPTCGCCKAWVMHLQASGFSVVAHDVGDTSAMRSQLGMPAKLASCHTARIGGYAIEGHVPAADVKRLLSEKPHAIGLSVPGMPVGSPGMEQGDQRDKYAVLLVLHDGETRIYQSHP